MEPGFVVYMNSVLCALYHQRSRGADVNDTELIFAFQNGARIRMVDLPQRSVCRLTFDVSLFLVT